MNIETIKDILKKFWFVILVGTILVAFAIYFAWDTNKDTIGAKSADGKDVIFSLANKNYTADEYYDELFSITGSDSETPSGVILAYTMLEREVVSQSVKATDEMKKTAEENFEAAEASFKSTQGKNYESYMDTELQKLGYSGVEDFEDYFLDIEKAKKMMNDYVKDNPELFDKIYEEKSPRVISHILVKVEKDKDVTAEQQAKMDKIDELLKDEDFGKIAKEYSEDTNSAVNNGSLGIQTSDSSLVSEFKDAAWKLKDGEVSGWVRTEHGYHKIKIDTTKKDKMLKDYTDAVVTAVQEANPNLRKKVVWEKAEKLSVEIKDKDLKAQLLTYMGVETEKE
ncbi:foldase protein PrsA [Breznakia blatticola]|uniref:peptidylprolyl isomerase n=1 Tax=Breznakia blatticola TaxID=1754012 RepID=A0A4R7Z8U6_9FIRM|nr:foldase protein PrsA [Breznakia blatticola]TDW13146.1 foldase protein PrsA [Breznakia blatticola]